MPSVIIYCRRSQDKKGQVHSLEAQKNKILDYVVAQGYDLAEDGIYEETASGTDIDRPVLADCFKRCAEEGHKLLVLRIDRLSRRLSQVASLFESGSIDLECVETGPVNPMVVQMLAVVAAEELRLLKVRTREGVRQAQAAGKPIGTQGHKDKGAAARARGLEVRQAKARVHAWKTGGFIALFRGDGVSWYKVTQIANQIPLPLASRRWPSKFRDGSWKVSHHQQRIKKVYEFHQRLIAEGYTEDDYDADVELCGWDGRSREA